MNPLPITDADVHAYVDGQLAPSRAPAIEEALARDPALAARVAELREQNAALRDAFDPWLAEPVPRTARRGRRGPALAAPAPDVALDRPRRRRRRGARGRRRRRLVRPRAAASQREGTPTTFARQAALAHALYASDVNRPVEIWAAEENRLVDWLSRRLGFPVRAPDLNSLGFALVGGRLVAGNENPTALFVYENARQAAAVAAGAQADARPAARPRSATRWRTASACTTGSTRTAATRCRATSTARSSSRSAASCTASSRRWKRHAEVDGCRTRMAGSIAPRLGAGRPSARRTERFAGLKSARTVSHSRRFASARDRRAAHGYNLPSDGTA